MAIASQGHAGDPGRQALGSCRHQRNVFCENSCFCGSMSHTAAYTKRFNHVACHEQSVPSPAKCFPKKKNSWIGPVTIRYGAGGIRNHVVGDVLKRLLACVDTVYP